MERTTHGSLVVDDDNYDNKNHHFREGLGPTTFFPLGNSPNLGSPAKFYKEGNPGPPVTSLNLDYL